MYSKIPPQSDWYDPINGLKVVSMFDGISCGLVALIRAGFKIARYVAFEIDDNAITVSQWNFDIIEHRGTVEGVDFTEFEGFDLLIGGSPCQGFSFAGKQLNFEDPRSALFFEFVRAKNEINPRYFLLENVAMKNDWADLITVYMGVEPVKINSALVSGGLRSRLYWSNIVGIVAPDDKGVSLQSLLIDAYTDREKSLALLSSYNHGSTMYNARRYFGKKIDMIVFKNEKAYRKLIEVWACDPYAEFDLDKEYARPLSPVECERIQTLPDNYTDGVTNTQRHKALGNGWTVDVIAHIFNFMHDDIL